MIPSPAPRRQIQVACAIVERDGRVLAALRGPAMSMPNLWEFPGGKLDPGETTRQCLRRELLEELEISISVGRPLTPVTHHYPGLTVTLHPFICRVERGEPLLREHAEVLWLEPEELSSLKWAAADEPVLEEYLNLRKSAPPFHPAPEPRTSALDPSRTDGAQPLDASRP